MNYTWDNIILDNFIKASKGNLTFVAESGEITEETVSAWFKIQDEYIQTMDSETIEIKRYKKICYKYAVKLREWMFDPREGTRVYSEVNKLYIQKQKLAKEIFSDEVTDWDKLVAKASIGSQFRIDSQTMRAKEFFNIIKVL